MGFPRPTLLILGCLGYSTVSDTCSPHPHTHTCFWRCPAMSFKLLRKLKCGKRRKRDRKEKIDSLLLYICIEAGRHRQKCLWGRSWNLVGTSKTEKEWRNYWFIVIYDDGVGVWVMYVSWCVCSQERERRNGREKEWKISLQS